MKYFIEFYVEVVVGPDYTDTRRNVIAQCVWDAKSRNEMVDIAGDMATAIDRQHCEELEDASVDYVIMSWDEYMMMLQSQATHWLDAFKEMEEEKE